MHQRSFSGPQTLCKQLYSLDSCPVFIPSHPTQSMAKKKSQFYIVFYVHPIPSHTINPGLKRGNWLSNVLDLCDVTTKKCSKLLVPRQNI
jgi:hypothetical protein